MSAFLGTLETDLPRRRPGDSLSLGIGERDDCIVKSALDMRNTHGDVLTNLRLAASRLSSCFSCHTLFLLLLSAHCALWPLAGAGIRRGTLPANGEPSAVP